MCEHGSPSFGAFNHEQFKLCQKDSDGYRLVKITGEELSDCDGEEELRDRLDLLMCLAPEDGRFWVGADTGYTNDPSEVTVWREDEEGVMRLVFRLPAELKECCLEQTIQTIVKAITIEITASGRC